MSRKGNKAPGLALCAIGLLMGNTAQAQSSVTLFGVLDGGLLYTSKTLDPKTGQNAGKQFSMIDGGSYYSQFGLVGTEDLGGGYKAKFRLVSGLNIATGGLFHCNGNLFGCEAWIGMEGPPGELKLGLQYSPFFLAVYDSDPRSLSLFGSGAIPLVDNVLGTGLFNANAVSYTSPVLGGLQASVLYAFGGQAGNFQAGRQYSARLRYQLGGLSINAAIYDGNSGGTAQTPVPTTVQYEGRMVGVGYQFGSLTAKASFVNYKVAGSFNNNVYGGGLTWFVMPTLDVNGGVWVTSDRNHTANHSVLAALGTDYFLSKATTLYAQVGMVNNHGAMNTGLSVTGALYGVPGTSVGAVIGIRPTIA
ncbi:porin [Paraburkholderia sp. CNPSo 3272]|uniref:porin n=1 Tax=Paraburkholderia sp. CNPSo 3272 TaxID=2940931 RepID=UPI0020B8B954|nr:porin [Paraburkholderia sp. CNPSo 3272]MCP3725905.1 porin [Paraburkholderia sp. CNPSo 3272]